MKRRGMGVFGISTALAISIGCGSTVDETNPNSSGGAGGSNATSSSTSTSTPTSSSTGSGGAGGACAGYDDATASTSVTLRFVNQSPQPIYLSAICGHINYTLSPVGETDAITYDYDASCLQTCAGLQKEPPLACGGDCIAQAKRIEPNGTFELVWNGTGLDARAMPAACYESPANAAATCGQIVAASPAMYSISAMGYASCEGPCTCDDMGNCDGMATGNTALSDSTTFDYPNQKQVDVVFNACAFGCPGG